MKKYETHVFDYIEKTTGAHVVKAVTTYAGKSVCAVAKCAPEDTFDLKFGTDVALKRLDVKIAKKRAADMSEYIKFCNMNLKFIEQEKRRVKQAKEHAEVAVGDRRAEIMLYEAELEAMLKNI
jgi:hypothetical protein